MLHYEWENNFNHEWYRHTESDSYFYKIGSSNAILLSFNEMKISE